MKTREHISVQDAASFWVVRMHSDQVTSEDERLFSAWLAEDSSHGLAYDWQNKLWRGVGALRQDRELSDQFADLRQRRPQPRHPSRRGLLAASVGGGLAVAGSWVAWETLFATKAYATEVGEQQRVVLPDGSTVTLNTDTAVRVRFDTAERRVWLDKGQAYFVIANDAARPFRVFTGDEQISANRTAVDVRRVGSGARFTLEEGVAQVYRGGEGKPVAAEALAIILRPGQRILLTPSAPAKLSRVDTRSVGAWRFGRMIFDSEALGDAVAEINRYNDRQIVIADPSLEAMAINGVFQTGKPEAFVQALTAAFPVAVKSQDAETIYLQRRPA